ncbi:protein kinase [Kitasatospora sp. NPDC059646]|uniref:protein kinase domain-containing protein n=1 Tax=Kitasatospora sp. NPDC059646 TaxID=3346893 RepID=UPI00369A0DB7
MTNEQHPGSRPADRPPQTARWELPDYAHRRELGTGASGRVVLAHHLPTGTPVAIKYLLGHHPDQAAFRVEAELLAALDSPHVTRLHEYVESPHGAAIVMELVDGVSLRELLKAEGGTGPEAALAVLKGSLLGLAAAHRAGVVHRDYKPGNVLVTRDGTSKLVDFGIAVRTGTAGAVAGTPAYMAPEQWAGKPASPATDVYAATATFFECLTGAKPYAGTTLMELAVQHTEAEIPATQAPEALRPLIRAGLAKSPDQRPVGAEALIGELEAAAGAAYGADWEERGRRRLAALVALLPLLLPSAGDPAIGGTTYATTVLPAGPPARHPGRRARGQLIAAAGALVLAAGALTAVAAADPGDGPGAVTAPAAVTTVGPAAEPPTGADPSTSAPSTAAPAASPGATASATAGPSPSSSTAKPATSPKPSATADPAGPATSAAPTAPTPTPTPSSAAPIAVALGRIGVKPFATTLSAYVPVTVRTAGPGTATVTFAWRDGDTGEVVGTTAAGPVPAGTTTVTSSFTFPCGHRSGTVTVTTSPAAGNSATTGPYLLICPPR